MKKQELGFFRGLKKYYKYAVRSAKAELKSEVADSYLNWLWWIIEPLCFTAIYAFVFTVIFENKEPYFASFAMIGQAVWQFFERMVSGSVKLIANNRDLVSKVYLPKYILLLAKSFTYLFKFGIAMGICLVLMLLQGVNLSWEIFWAVPVVLVLYLVAFGIGLIFMNLGVFLSDLSNLTNIGMRMLFYLSGIFYSIKLRLQKFGALASVLLYGNPAAFAMNELRNCMLYGETVDVKVLGIWCGVGLVLVFCGVRLIRRNENTYAKVI